MNKKWIGLILVIIFSPAIIAGFWYLSVTGNKLTADNVSFVSFAPANEETVSFTSERDKEFFIEFKDSFVSIEDQEFDSDVYALYKLDYHRIQGDITYFLCLSADTRNCLAFDENDNWYRIGKDKAQELLLNYQVTDVYKYSNIPALSVFSVGEDVKIFPKLADWNYLVADDSYKNVSSSEDSFNSDSVKVSTLNGLDLSFEVEPDWYGIKLYDGDLFVCDGLNDISIIEDSELKAVISAEWYKESNSLYNGKATYEFDLYYDIAATYAINKTEIYAGEVIYIVISNANDENFDISCEFTDADIAIQNYEKGQLVIVPVPMDTSTGEYRIKLSSAKTNLNIPVTVKAKDFGSVKVGLIKSENHNDYNEALEAFKNEISVANDIVLAERYSFDGWLTPVQKFVDNKEQYWVSAPSYGVEQIVDGVTIEQRNFGVHYVKSVDTEKLSVRSVADGVVAFSGQTSAYGNTVVIEHGYGIKSVYGHLDEVSVSVGERIEGGKAFAVASAQNYSISSKELFFAVYINDTFVNPFVFISEPRKSDDSEKSEAIEFFANR